MLRQLLVPLALHLHRSRRSNKKAEQDQRSSLKIQRDDDYASVKLPERQPSGNSF